MDADSCYFDRRAREERAAAESALDPVAQCAHFELAMRYDHLGHAEDGISNKTVVARNADDEHGKFGVEQSILYDFRDYGLD